MSRTLILAGYACMFAAGWATLQGRFVLAAALAIFMIFFWLALVDEPSAPTTKQPAARPNPAFELTQDYLAARRKIDEVGHSYNYLFNHPDDGIWDDDQYRPDPESGPEKR